MQKSCHELPPPRQTDRTDPAVELEFLIDAAQVLIAMNRETICDIRRLCEDSRFLRARARRLRNLPKSHGLALMA
jgi:hypothetical protein